MFQYKENLEVLNGRYTDVERQVLKVYAKEWAAIESAGPESESVLSALIKNVRGGSVGLGQISIHESMWWLLSNLLDDGIVAISPSYPGVVDAPPAGVVQLTIKGLKMIERMIDARPI
ncbi:hypothetical protein [Streptomyces sp. NPDC092952]|uniref:hypothetical protein n=1 Tax=Streptomyces sp. NPDC092952 TaxID=3366018 RepID=UPI00380CBB68